jgi:hypothetical protein
VCTSAGSQRSAGTQVQLDPTPGVIGPLLAVELVVLVVVEAVVEPLVEVVDVGFAVVVVVVLVEVVLVAEVVAVAALLLLLPSVGCGGGGTYSGMIAVGPPEPGLNTGCI